MVAPVAAAPAAAGGAATVGAGAWYAIGTGVSAFSGMMGRGKADKAKKAAARKSAKLSWQQTLEEVRRMERQQDINVGEIKAGIGQSGVTMSGTPATFLEDVVTEQNTQRDYALDMGAKRRDAIKDGVKTDWYNNALQGVAQGVSAWAGWQATK